MLSIGVAALAVPLVAFISEAAGDFYRLLLVLAGFSATIVLAALWLPRDQARHTGVLAVEKAGA